MYAFATTMLIGWAVLVSPNGAGQAQEGSTPSTPADTASAIAVKQTKPMRVVFVEHAGAYWMAGPVLARVREYMLEHDQSGPLFVRYLQNPMGPAVGRLRAEVGFIVKSDHVPEPPFRIAQRRPELVAYLVVDGRSALTRHDYAVIHEWIQGHGYHTAGPVTEIYDPVPPGGAGHTQRTEIQVTLLNDRAQLRTGSPSRERERPVDKPGARAWGSDQGRGLGHGDLRATGEPPRGRSPSTAGEESEPEPAPSEAEPVQPVARLIAAKQFDRIAEQLMPNDRAITTVLQVWFGQVVFRIGAVAKGIEQVYPGEGRTVAAIADAITRRYKRVSADFTLDPLGQAVVRFDARMDPLAGRKRAIMRDLDRLLGRIALRGVGVDGAVEELADIVQGVQDLMEAQCRETPRSAPP